MRQEGMFGEMSVSGSISSRGLPKPSGSSAAGFGGTTRHVRIKRWAAAARTSSGLNNHHGWLDLRGAVE